MVMLALAKISQPSGYSERQPIHLLAGEIAETASNIGLDQPLPYVAGVIASRLLQILTDPLHYLYKKANNFLNRGPRWAVEKLPSYWTDRILMRSPTEDENHYLEIAWLLDTFTDSLRTPMDMEIYRRCHILERFLTLAASPKLPSICFEKLVDLLFRCTYVEGSTTLITRCGLMSWLEIQLAKDDCVLKPKLQVLGRRAYESSDRARVNEWSTESLVSRLA